MLGPSVPSLGTPLVRMTSISHSCHSYMKFPEATVNRLLKIDSVSDKDDQRYQ